MKAVAGELGTLTYCYRDVSTKCKVYCLCSMIIQQLQIPIKKASSKGLKAKVQYVWVCVCVWGTITAECPGLDGWKPIYTVCECVPGHWLASDCW